MESKEPSFLDENQSVASLITLLRDYFRNSHSRYKVDQSRLISQLDSADEETQESLRQQLRQADAGITLFGILGDALSIADRVLHSSSVMSQLGLDNEVYRVHHETPEEIERERKAGKWSNPE